MNVVSQKRVLVDFLFIVCTPLVYFIIFRFYSEQCSTHKDADTAERTLREYKKTEAKEKNANQSTVTAFAKFLGRSGLMPFKRLSSYAISCSGITPSSAVKGPFD